jgi:hypothetical protein
MRIYLILFLFIWSFSLSANHIKKGFKELEASNYSYALAHFQKGIKKHTAVAAYGMARLYLSPAKYNIDSCYKYLLMSEKSFSLLDNNKREKIKVYTCDSISIAQMKMSVSELFFDQLRVYPTLSLTNEFITKHSWSDRIPMAIDIRDSFLFASIVLTNQSSYFQDFINAYPTSKYRNEAKSKFYSCQYNELTASDQVDDLEAFLKTYPENPYCKQVEYRLYLRFTSSRDIDEITYFVRHFPLFKTAQMAWRTLFYIYVKDYSLNSIQDFKATFPDCPFMNEIEYEISLFKTTFYPFKLDNKYGFIKNNDEVVIPALYEEVRSFREGLAVVLSSDLYGAIDKKNQKLIDFQYDNMEDFNLGLSIVEKNRVFGVIDRDGDFVFPLEYQDIGWLSDSLLYVKKNNLFGIYNINNVKQCELFFEDIIPFRNNIARVLIAGKIGYIDRKFRMVLPAEFEDLVSFTDSSFIYSVGDKKGLVFTRDLVKTGAVYDEIFPIQTGIAMVRVKDKIGYIDAAGNLILALQFEQFTNYAKVGAFTDRGAIVRKKNKFLLIDTKGKVLLTLPYELIGECGDWIPCMKNFKWGFINPSGKEMTLFEYDFVEKVTNNLYILEKAGLVGLFSTSGTFVLPLNYASIEKFENNLFLVEDSNGFGVSTREGKFIVPTSFPKIRYYDQDTFELYSQHAISYYLIKSGVFINPK